MKVTVVDGKMRRVWEIVKRLEGDEIRRFVEYGWRSEGVGQAMRVSERVAAGLLRMIWCFDVMSREADDGDVSASVRAEAGSQVVDGKDEQRASNRTELEGRTAHLHRWLGLSSHIEVGSPEFDGNDRRIVPVRKDSGQTASNESDEQVKSSRSHTGTWAADKTGEQRDTSGTNEDMKLERPQALKWDRSHWNRDFLTSLNWALRVWLKRGNGDQDHVYARIVESGGVRDVVAAEKMKAVLLEEFNSISQRGEFRAGV